jgi:hypothetical protein
MSDTSESPPPHLVDHHAYGDAKVSFAVDVSGSTAGSILRAESNFVQQCATLLSEGAKERALILPWNDNAQTPRSLHRLSTLTAGGYTIPGAIILDQVCQAALKTSSLWFLLTDGLIDEVHRLRFAELIAKQGLHGTSCITAIFGSAGPRGPSSCNISVGISVFAVVPNCLFLFNDVPSGQIYILQCKGIFNSLLHGQANPTIDDDTPWSILPRLSVAQLGMLVIPPPTKLSSDEIALQDDLVINFQALWANKLSKDQVSRILDNDDSLKSVMQTAQTRGQSHMFQSWVQKQEIKVEDPVHKPRTDIGGQVEALFKNILSLLQKGEKMTNPQLTSMQTSLRMAYAANMSALLGATRQSQQESEARTSSIQSAFSRASLNIHSAQTLSPVATRPLGQETVLPAYKPTPLPGVAFWTPGDGRPDYPQVPPPPYQATYAREPGYDSPSYPAPNFPSASEKWESSGLLYTRGFRLPSPQAAFRGSCSICGSDKSILAWLFHSPPTHLRTQDFPARNSASVLAFPLAMGNFPETNILSSTICCEACSSLCVAFRTSPQSEHIIGALPMVSYQANSAAWHSTLFQSFGSRFAKEHLAQLFLAVLLTASEMASQHADAQDPAAWLFRGAVTWATSTILGESTAVMELSASFSPGGPGSTSQRILSTVLAESLAKVNAPRAPLLLYPLEGFKIILRAIDICDPSGISIPLKTRELAVYRRVLHLLVEQFVLGGGASTVTTSDSQNISNFMSRLLWTENSPQDQGDTEMEEDGDFVLAEVPPSPQPTPGSSSPSPTCSIPISQLGNSPLLPDPLYKILYQIKEFRGLEEPHLASVYGPPTALFLHAVDTVARGDPGLAVDPNNLFERVMNMSSLSLLSTNPSDVTEKMVLQQFGGRK